MTVSLFLFLESVVSFIFYVYGSGRDDMWTELISANKFGLPEDIKDPQRGALVPGVVEPQHTIIVSVPRLQILPCMATPECHQ
jgi:hypothetical protein